MSASSIPPWFDRKFDFTFPVEQHATLCVRLLGAPARLEEIVRGLPLEALVRKPEGKWSAQEHAGHLTDLESLWMVRLEDFLSEGQTLTVADLTNRKTHEANHNAGKLSDILAQFRNARLRLTDRLTGLAPAHFARSLVHPRLQQPMRLVDHLSFVAEHDDHHLAKIWELIGHGGSEQRRYQKE